MGTEEQVWQRVFAPAEMGQDRDTEELLRQSRALSARYQAVLARSSGRRRALAAALLEGERAAEACLRGLARLERRNVRAPRHAPAPPPLEECWHRTRRCLVEYTARSAAGEAGPVYRSLARRAEEQLTLLTELLGCEEGAAGR